VLFPEGHYVLAKEIVSLMVIFAEWLWTAPEHIRENKIGGSAKGDTYSFGIILQEVITESLPFSTVNLTPTGMQWLVVKV